MADAPLEPTPPPSWLGVWILLAAALLAIGLALPRFVISDGLRRFHDQPDRRVVAARAYEGAWLLNSHPVARLLLPVARVEEVRFEPGSCPAGEPGSDEPGAQFTARVRFYTLFALPGPSVRARCGGWSWAWSTAPPG